MMMDYQMNESLPPGFDLHSKILQSTQQMKALTFFKKTSEQRQLFNI